MPKLVLKNKSEVLLEYIIEKDNVTVGRVVGNDIVIIDKSISDEHCEIKKENGKYVIRDLKTSFGTTVNGEKITKRELNFNDEIGLGEHTLVFRATAKETPDEKKTTTIQTGSTAVFDTRGEIHCLLGIQASMKAKSTNLILERQKSAGTLSLTKLFFLTTLLLLVGMPALFIRVGSIFLQTNEAEIALLLIGEWLRKRIHYH